MKKKKTHNYILVFSNSGPRFVTELNFAEKTCKWDGAKPFEFCDEGDARFTALILSANSIHAVAVTSMFEIEIQPHDYSEGHFEWIWNN